MLLHLSRLVLRPGIRSFRVYVQWVLEKHVCSALVVWSLLFMSITCYDWLCGWVFLSPCWFPVSLFRWGHFYCSVFEVRGLFPLFLSWYCFIHWPFFFLFGYIMSSTVSAWFFFVASVSLAKLFLYRNSPFLYICFGVFIVAHWSAFATTVLKPLSHNCHICVLLVLASAFSQSRWHFPW